MRKATGNLVYTLVIAKLPVFLLLFQKYHLYSSLNFERNGQKL